MLAELKPLLSQRLPVSSEQIEGFWVVLKRKDVLELSRDRARK